MVATIRSKSRLLSAAWLAIGLGLVALVPMTEHCMVYNNTGNEGGGSALWVDVPLTLLGLWLSVPLGVLALRARSKAGKAAWVLVTVAFALAWWSYVSTETAHSAGGLRPLNPRHR